jgi:hypothetical protein
MYRPITPLQEQLARWRAGGVDFTGLACCFTPPAALWNGRPVTRLRADLSLNLNLMARIILFAYRVSSLRLLCGTYPQDFVQHRMLRIHSPVSRRQQRGDMAHDLIGVLL